MALTWNKLEIPLAAGLNQKGDVRAGDPPALDLARDIQFDEIGGVQTRLPYVAMSNAIFGGGTLANCRRLGIVNNELCVFTDTSLYSWNAQLTKWVLRGTHLAVAVEETPRFTSTGDQREGDRAELNGTVVETWTEQVGSFDFVFIAAFDKATGSVLMAPNTFGAVSNRPRLVALATKILLFCISSTGLEVRAIDPANPTPGATGAGTTVIAGAVFDLYYDVVKAGTQDLAVGAARRVITTSHTAFSVTPSLVVTAAVKARTADGPLAVSTIPDGTQTQVIRANVANIQGDLLTTSTLVDVFTGQAVGSGTAPINQIAACHRSVQNSGAFRCHAFWTSNQSTTGLTWSTKTNWVDSAGVLGAQAVLALQVSVASRAFDCNGSVYVWAAFGSSTIFASPSGFATGTTLQNSYFLYRDDAFLCAKSVAGSGGGFASSIGRLPGVSAVTATSFAWCATKRRKFFADSVKQTDFAARSPVDIEFVFDSNDARRMARIGRTGYIAAGEVLQYDGTRLVECGFHVFPWGVGAIEVPGGSLTAGSVYAYKGTFRYQNGQLETERSTTATIGTITLTTGTRVDLLSTSCLTVTHKLAVPPAIELWRTSRNPPDVDAPFKLITSTDPSATNPNRYLANDQVAGFAPTVQDVLADTALGAREANPENGAVLESLAPPAAQIIIATDTRVYLAGVSGDPDAVWYSRLRNEGEVASFHDGNRALVPRAGGAAMTALAFNNETLTVFRQSAIYALPGDGLNNLGQGSNYGPARLISNDVGAVSQEAVGLTPRGLVFKSSKGWYLLGPDWGLRYIGDKVVSFDSEQIFAVNVVETQHHVRILTENRVLIWDYLVDQWGEWTIATPVDAIIWNGTHVLLTATGPVQQQTTFSGTTYGLDVETSWIKASEQQGDAQVKTFSILGEYRSAHLLRIRVARDYQYLSPDNPAYFDDAAWIVSPTTVGSALQVQHAPTLPRCQSFKVRITAVSESLRATLLTTALGPQVATSGAVWTATWSAAATKPGEMGNAITMTIAFVPFVAPAVDEFPYDLPFYFVSSTASVVVNDNFTWSGGRWVEDLNNIAVVVAGTLTVADLEAGIAAGTALATCSVHDVAPTKTVNVASMIAAGLVSTGAFTGGAYGTPTGEALKLTGLAAMVGVQPGIRRQPVAQVAP